MQQRERFGLPPLPAVPVEEIQKLLDPDAGGTEAATLAREPKPALPREGQKRFAFFPGCLIPARHPGSRPKSRRAA